MPKIFSSLESQTTFDEILKVTSVPFFVPDFNLLSYKFDSLHLNYYISIDILVEQNKIVEHILNTFTVPFEKFKTVSLPSIMKKTVAPDAWSKFPVKLFFLLLSDQPQVLVALFLSSYDSF